MLQHASIDTFVRHYSVGIHVDAQAIVRGMPAQKELMRFASSMSRSIDPRRPWRLDDSSCINDVPSVRTLADKKQARKRIRDDTKRTYEEAREVLERRFGDGPQNGSRFREIRKQWKAQEKGVKKLQTKYEHTEEKFELSVKQLRNEKGRQRHILIRENLERYKNEQPVIDSERQLSGKMVDEEVKVALESTGYMTPQHMTLIDTVLTMPGATTEKEYERRIAAINAVMAVCDAEEGAPSLPRTTQKRSVEAIDMSPADPVPKRQRPTNSDAKDNALSQAIASVCVKSPKEEPTICFICLGNQMLPESERLRKFKNSGSFSRHFVNKHIKPFPNGM